MFHKRLLGIIFSMAGCFDLRVKSDIITLCDSLEVFRLYLKVFRYCRRKCSHEPLFFGTEKRHGLRGSHPSRIDRLTGIVMGRMAESSNEE